MDQQIDRAAAGSSRTRADGVELCLIGQHMIKKKRQPGFENVENLVQHACRGMDFSMISDYFGQQ